MQIVLPHSIEWKEGELTVSVSFLVKHNGDDIYYAEVNIWTENSMKYTHPVNISGRIFRMASSEDLIGYDMLKAIVKPIIKKRNESQTN